MITERHLLPGDVIRFTYTNWKGRIAVRIVEYERMTVGNSQMPNTQPGSLELYLRGFDLDKQADRCYHVSGIHQGTIEYASAHFLGKLKQQASKLEPLCECDPSQGCGVPSTTNEELNG